MIIHILSGLVLGFSSALWGWADGISLWELLGSYALGSALGVIASAMGVLLASLYGFPDEEDIEETSPSQASQPLP